ncbi:hypothetical protein BCR37DRAFT_344853 [Protomyces lactucae-debilis]|uniref:Octanoyltransferase n=1 Tax=Protomyces lactucae-debilis TaxID=2754530 RepID=A0A1Y2FNL2_PROLT|nr:uncharacterized protein BCR37DRAFT_344853 [Protomyces lactucae-debilis]ORY84924.1 hypothetical protein BCR37DRAFT_344853 [Protomyces lactucae-debilis]
MIRHTRLRSPCSYQAASAVQESLVRSYLDKKATGSFDATVNILTMEMLPVYTTGRRERGLMSPGKLASLKLPHADTGVIPTVVEALRGGQTTVHTPGQLVAYPIFDLKAYDLSPRCYVHLLESSIIQTLAQYNIQAKRTSNTGVWVSEQAKIAAIGIHLRRNITSHGIALNICNDLSWFSRIVACGLAGKQTTSMVEQGVNNVIVQDVARIWIQQMAQLLKIDAAMIDTTEASP